MDRWTPIPLQRAREVSRKLGLVCYPINAAQVVRELGIDLKEIASDDLAFDGCALKEEGLMGILVNSRVPYASRKNFTIAHELGHCCIETHLDPEYRCTLRKISSFDPRDKTETEASEFAAELLMPEGVFDHTAARVPLSLLGMGSLAEKFGTSLSATSIHYIRLSPDPCAIILSCDTGILWGVQSRSFPFELRHDSLSESSYAVDYFRGTKLPIAGQPVLRSAWAKDGADKPSITLIEESRQFERLAMVLTLLKLEDDFSSSEEQDGGDDDG